MSSVWTSRERVVAAINHRQPDRVPIDINLVRDFYINLKDYLHLEIDEEIKANSAMEVIPHPEVLAKLGADLTSVKLGSAKRKKTPRSDGLAEDEWGVVRKEFFQPAGGSYLEVVHHPLADATLADLQKYPWPIPDLPGRGEGAEQSSKRLYEDTELGLVGRFGGPILETLMNMLGMEQWFIRLAQDPEFCHTALEIITDIMIELDRIGLQAAGKYLTIFKVSGEDFGMQTGPLYSPKMFREMFLPYFQRRCQAARKQLDEVNPEAKIMLHSCGGIRPLIPDLIAAGVQILDPVQPRAAGMESEQLKADFGEQLVFHGGIDIQQVLPTGTIQEVEAETRHRIKAFGVGGGYILAPSHAVQADVPPANLVAMCQTSLKYGTYPLSI